MRKLQTISWSSETHGTCFLCGEERHGRAMMGDRHVCAKCLEQIEPAKITPPAMSYVNPKLVQFEKDLLAGKFTAGIRMTVIVDGCEYRQPVKLKPEKFRI